MNNQDIPDLYGVLGVSTSASKDDLRDVYRKIAKENHPDKLNDLPENDRNERTEMMYRANEAFSVLSDPKKREEYDALRRHAEVAKEGGIHSIIYEGKTFDEIFNEIFGENSIFSQATKERTHFSIPENDVGLLAALVEAYKAEGEGKWRVKKFEKEERDWVPDIIYSVIRKEGKVFVYRRIDDWREGKDRSEPIRIRKEGSYNLDKEIPPDHFLGEYYLAGRGRALMESGIWEIPGAYAGYLTALKSLARKLVEGKINISQELTIIEGYSKDPFNKVRLEGNKVWDDPNNELVRTIKIQDLSSVLREAESRIVQVEGDPKGQEGQKQNPKTPETTSPSSGESEAGY